MSFRPGELDQVVTIRREVRNPDGAGGFTASKVDVCKTFALVRPLTGGERQAADRTEATAGYLVVIPARSGIDETHEVYWHDRARTLGIRFAKLRNPRSLYLEIECDAGVAV